MIDILERRYQDELDHIISIENTEAPDFAVTMAYRMATIRTLKDTLELLKGKA